MPWMNLEDIVLHEISQTRKDIVWFYFSEILRIVKFIETERLEVIRSWRRGLGNDCLIGTEFLFGMINKFLK
jgi:hypothetical protein